MNSRIRGVTEQRMYSAKDWGTGSQNWKCTNWIRRIEFEQNMKGGGGRKSSWGVYAGTDWQVDMVAVVFFFFCQEGIKHRNVMEHKMGTEQMRSTPNNNFHPSQTLPSFFHAFWNILPKTISPRCFPANVFMFFVQKSHSAAYSSIAYLSIVRSFLPSNHFSNSLQSWDSFLSYHANHISLKLSLIPGDLRLSLPLSLSLFLSLKFFSSVTQKVAGSISIRPFCYFVIVLSRVLILEFQMFPNFLWRPILAIIMCL